MNDFLIPKRLLSVLSMLGLAMAATGVAGAEPEAVFLERFEGGPGDRWKIDSTLEPPQLRWHEAGETAGLHFRSVAVEKFIKSHGYAWAEWDIGDRPFQLNWDVELERGLEQQWFLPGVAVAMTSAPPGELGQDDVAVTMSVHMAGIAASVRQGGLFDMPTEGRGAYANISDKKLWQPRGEGTGGAASVAWPMKHPSGARLRFEMLRTAEDKVRFTVRWPGLPAGRGQPYWTGEYQLPEDVAEVPLRYVTVKRMPVLSVHVSYAGFVMQGVVRNIQGRRLSAVPAPVVERFTQEKAVLTGGAELALHGKHFREGASVSVGGKPATNVRVESAEKLTCTLPALAANERHALSVANPNGLAGDLARGVPYGRLLEQVRPREAAPGGGDVVHLLGAGFEDKTIVTIGGQRVEVLERLGATRLKARVPAGKLGPAKVVAETGDHGFAGEPLFGYAAHPYLFFRAADVAGLREKFDKPMFRHDRRRILGEANGLAKREVGQGHNASVGATFNLAFAWVFTGEEAYKKKLMQWVRQGWAQTRFNDFKLMSLAGMALAYDVLYPELSPEDRAAFQDYLDRGIEGYHAFSGAWFLGGHANFSNTVPVGNSGGMLAGLAMMHSTPRAQKAVDVAARKARLYPDRCISPDGGCREGVQYWDFGGSFHLILAHALKHATGDDRGLLDHPHLEANVNFIRTTLGGHGGQFAFNDTKQPWLGGYAVCADLGSRYNQPLMLWVADLAAKGGEKTRARGTWAPFAFLWRSEQPAPEQFPGVPKVAWLKDMQWGAIRSDGSFQPKLVVGVKGGRGPLTHHKQQDLGSYVLHANGEAYLVDPGYYEPEPTDHTLPLISGEGPGVSGASITDGWEEDPWRHMAVDATEGYGESVQRVRRLIVMHGEDRLVIVDDILPADGHDPPEVTAQFQTAWIPKIDMGGAHPLIVEGEKGRLGVRCFGHEIELAAENRRFTSGWHWKKISEEGPGDWHSVRGKYPSDPDRPLVTVLQPAAGDADLPKPPAVRYAGERITVSFPDGVKVRFKQETTGWRLVRP